MPTPVVCAPGLLLTILLAGPVPAGRGGEKPTQVGQLAVVPPFPTHTFRRALCVDALIQLDTTRRPASADTTRRLALVPDTTPVPADEEKPTRKTTLLTVLAIAVLTVSTLLLYNVRSR